MAEALAGLAALFYAGSAVTVKRGVQDTSLLVGLLISLGVGSAATLTLLLIVGTDGLRMSAVIGGFVVAGILGPGLGRGSSMVGVHLLGPSRSVPLQAALYPVFASTFAIIFLGESVGWGQAMGLVLVGCGVWFLSSRGPTAVPELRPHLDLGRFRLPSLVFPLLAGLSFGLSDLFRKTAIHESGDALLDAAVGTMAAFAFWSLLALAGGSRLRSSRLGPGAAWFALSGLLGATAITLLIKALDLGDVSVVSPIVAAEPLGVLILSAAFLRKLELLTARVVLGALAVVAGTMVVSYFG